MSKSKKYSASIPLNADVKGMKLLIENQAAKIAELEKASASWKDQYLSMMQSKQAWQEDYKELHEIYNALKDKKLMPQAPLLSTYKLSTTTA